MILIENTVLQPLLQFEQYAYFVNHASSDFDILIGTFNFLLVFIILPCAILALIIYGLIKTGTILHKHFNEHNGYDEDEKE